MKSVYKASDSIEASLIIHQLKDEGIEAKIDGEYSQGVERIQNDGFVNVLVLSSDYDSAKKIVNDIKADYAPNDIREKNITKSGSKWKYLLFGILIGILGTVSHYYLPIIEQKIDLNNDNYPDETILYINSSMTKSEIDRNFDGQVDQIFRFNREGLPESSQSDDNFDGIYETKSKYLFGNIHESITDSTNDGFYDTRSYYKNGILSIVKYYDSKTKKPIIVEFYNAFHVTNSKEDLDGDGIFENTYVHNIYGDRI